MVCGTNRRSLDHSHRCHGIVRIAYYRGVGHEFRISIEPEEGRGTDAKQAVPVEKGLGVVLIVVGARGDDQGPRSG